MSARLTNPEILSHVKLTCCEKDCPDRAVGCHGKCKEYAKYRAKCDVEIKQRALKRDVDHAVADAMKRIPGKRGV